MYKVAITGGTSGIGRETVRILKERGCHITVFDIAEPEFEVDDFIYLDIASDASIDAALSKSSGPFDALCNIAGVPPRDGNQEKVLAINWIGLKLFTNGFLDKLNEGGAIVNMASRAGAMWRENLEQVERLLRVEGRNQLADFCHQESLDSVRAYALSKEAVVVWTMMECERMLNRGLRINSISPGAIETSIKQDFLNAFGDGMVKNIERVGRAGLPSEVAEVTAFLALPASNWLKGIDITVDGGMSACGFADSRSFA